MNYKHHYQNDDCCKTTYCIYCVTRNYRNTNWKSDEIALFFFVKKKLFT